MKTRLIAFCASAILLGVTGGAQATQLNFAFGFPSGSAVANAAEEFSAAVKERSTGDVTVRNYPLSLLSLAESAAGVRDGLADMAYVLTPYFPAEFAHYSLLSDLNIALNLSEQTGQESLAFAGAISEYALTRCPECLNEFEQQNQIYMGGGASPRYVLLCNKPVTSKEDLQGKRVRTGGAGFVRFAEHFEAVSIQIPANEVYEALSQGVIDCATLSMPELTNYNLRDVVTDITLGVPGGVYGGAATANINRDSWQALSVEQRKALLWGLNVMVADATWNYHEVDIRDREYAQSSNINVIEANEAFITELRAFAKADMARIGQIYKESYGVARAEEIIPEFTEMLEHWRGVVANVDSRDGLRDVFWKEIFSKIDPSTYGL